MIREGVLRGQILLTQVEIKQSRFSEDDIIEHRLRAIAAENKTQAKLTVYHREEGENMVMFHFVEEGRDPEGVEAWRNRLVKFPTLSL